MIWTKEDVFQNSEAIIKKIKEGAIFIYPTDTIYGIGCNALLEKSVKKIRELKNRPAQPFSVIAPSKNWIIENSYTQKEWLEKLPGPYTLIVKLKKKCVSPSTNNSLPTLGIRIPDHWITKLIEKANVPVITTSVNKSGEQFMTSLEDLDEDIKRGVDFIIYEGEKKGRPSTIIELDKDEVKIRERK